MMSSGKRSLRIFYFTVAAFAAAMENVNITNPSAEDGMKNETDYNISDPVNSNANQMTNDSLLWISSGANTTPEVEVPATSGDLYNEDGSDTTTEEDGNVEVTTPSSSFSSSNDLNNESEAVTMADDISSQNETNDSVPLENVISNVDYQISIDQSITSPMNEKIFLHRNNCNLDIPVDTVSDIRIQISFDPSRRGGTGKCCIAVGGRDTSSLALQITDVHLSDDEIIRVVLTNSGVEFVLKEYAGEKEGGPLLLTETHNAYIVLYYNTTTSRSPRVEPSQTTRFSLEVFEYASNRNKVNKQMDNSNNISYSSFKFTGLHTDKNLFY